MGSPGRFILTHLQPGIWGRCQCSKLSFWVWTTRLSLRGIDYVSVAYSSDHGGPARWRILPRVRSMTFVEPWRRGGSLRVR